MVKKFITGGSWVASTVGAAFVHGPLLILLVVYSAALVVAVVVTYVAAVFFTAPRKNLVALIKAWRWPRAGP